MQSVEELKLLVKEKWLNYYEANQDWIIIYFNATNGWVKCSSGGVRPNGLLLLGAITSSEPIISDWMSLFCQFQSDVNSLVKILGLDFDPNVAIKERIQQREEEEKQKALSQTAEVIGLLSEDPAYRAVQEGLDEIRAYGKKQENSS